MPVSVCVSGLAAVAAQQRAECSQEGLLQAVGNGQSQATKGWLEFPASERLVTQ